MRVDIVPYSLKLQKPLQVGGHTLTSREGAWLKGPKGGLGDVCPLPGFSLETYEEALRALHETQKDQHAPPSVDWALYCADLGPISSTAFEHVQCAGLLQSLEVEPKREEVIKLKVGRHRLRDEIDWIKKIAPNYKALRLDGNRSLSVEDTLKLASAAGDKLAFFEEPVPPVFLRSLVGKIPVALDESLLELSSVDPLMTKAAALVLKPSLLGHERLSRLIEFGTSENIEVIFSSLYESEVGQAHLRRLANTFAPQSAHGLGTRCALEKRWPQ